MVKEHWQIMISKSEVIVSVGADFLGDWQGGGFDSGYAKDVFEKRKNV